MSQVTFYSPTHALLAKEFSPQSSKKLSIIDYGCGEGELLHYLPTSQIKQYQGFEVNKACLPVAKKRWGKAGKFYFHYIDRNKLPSFGKPDSSDALFLVGVVQYLPTIDLDHVLKEAKRVIKPGGKIFISCTTDHPVYKWLNIYRFFLPHYSVNRARLVKKIQKSGFKIEQQYERGLFLTPLFSNIIVFFFDALDKVLFQTKGELGPVGRKVRDLWSPIIKKEFQLQTDFGYTLFVVASR